MKNALSKNALEMIGGVVAILLVLGAAYYMDAVQAVVAPAPVTTHDYSAAGADSLAASTTIGARFQNLQPVQAAEPAAIQYDPADIGKTDLLGLQ